ncbi:hypothetical protein [uncultured Mitsuokella sp.]|uniref:hypothetical protein n=1 Tax=uncultured Mitsuokella sp. TaxID=453120 RepID=UPI00261C324B|nr:hypothetical protein [uncultured Mitsuokella sp.]
MATKRKILHFLKNNQDTFCMMGIALLVPAVGLASDASQVAITPLQKPLETLIKFVTGPLAGIVTVGSLVTGIASYQMGWEQSITKKAGVGVCCGGAMTQVDTLCNSLGITASSLLF